MVRRIAINLIETAIFGGIVVGGSIGFLTLIGFIQWNII